MKHMTCPVNGERPISEFICWGKDRPEPHDQCTDEALAWHVFNAGDSPGTTAEWWCHRPSRVWFVAVRDVATGRVVGTLRPRDSGACVALPCA